MSRRRNARRSDDQEVPVGTLPQHIKNVYAFETVKICKEGFYTNKKGEKKDVSDMVKRAIESSIVVKPDQEFKLPGDDQKNGKGIIEVTREFSLEACQRLVKQGIVNPVCLNFASARNPGGGFCGLNEAQEENLCRSSALFFTQIQHPEMYQFNREGKSLLYSDYMIYSPLVPVWRNTKYDLLDDPYCISFISAPACNASRGAAIDELRSAMYKRCKKILDLALANGSKGIILGAYGCGVFKNNAEDVAGYFKRLLIDEGYLKFFDKVVFPIAGSKNAVFKGVLGV